MLNAILIEDERPAMKILAENLLEACPETVITQKLSSVAEALSYFAGNPHSSDIIFSDVQLSDGLSFEIFNQTNIQTPVIFITAYDQFMMNAFEYNGIDYLLKPVSRDELCKAVKKYKMLQRHFSETHTDVSGLMKYIQQKRRTRLIVKKGLESVSLKIEDIVLFYTENKIAFVVDKEGHKYMAEKNLGDIVGQLDERQFFRANRQYIVNLQYIRGFKPFEKVKLRVELIPEISHEIIVSQETAPLFRKWMQEA